MEDHCKRCKLATLFVFIKHKLPVPTIIIKISMFCAVFIIRQINVDCVHFLRSVDHIINKRIGKVTTLKYIFTCI